MMLAFYNVLETIRCYVPCGLGFSCPGLAFACVSLFLCNGWWTLVHLICGSCYVLTRGRIFPCALLTESENLLLPKQILTWVLRWAAQKHSSKWDFFMSQNGNAGAGFSFTNYTVWCLKGWKGSALSLCSPEWQAGRDCVLGLNIIILPATIARAQKVLTPLWVFRHLCRVIYLCMHMPPSLCGSDSQ